MTDETTTEQLVEIQGQAEPEPPDGWQLVPLGEPLKGGDEYHAGLDRYIRPIEPEPQPEPVQVCEGRWRTRGGWVRNVTPTPEGDGREQRFPWWDAQYRQTWTADGRYHFGGASALDLVEYLGPIEPQPEPQPEPESDTELQAQVVFLKNREVTLGTRLQQEREVTTRLRGELESVQVMLGESRQRVTQLEELVTSLRTINRGCENAVRDAGKENTALRNQLEAVKAELATQGETSRRLQIELDAAQQVPADSPELRQLRADLAEVAHDRDTYRHAHELLVRDIDATHQRTKAMTVEAIAEWLVPVQAAIAAADNVAESTRAGWLAEEVIQHLPKIMRSLTGLNDEEIE